ncbi:MAG: ATP-grasp domain-containing protein [Candidatus Caenarcaniphilales bacterium]|nr:ATP-grasp domain-containing protein [Candidatus Caenarcaniphilales bacterium]
MVKLAIIGPTKGPGQLGMLLGLAANKIHCEEGINLSLLTIGSDYRPDWSDDHYGISEAEQKQLNASAHIIAFETESIPGMFRESFKEKFVPSLVSLNLFRDRLEEKNFFLNLGLLTASFVPISSQAELNAVIENSTINFPARLKTCELGYDGHGQKQIKSADELQLAWNNLGQAKCILEEELNIHRELSVVITRFVDGQIIRFPIPENLHKKSVLYRSRLAELSEPLKEELYKMAEKMLKELNYVGTFCLEIVQLDNDEGDILINEAAPRVHNSGHFTLDFCEGTNQFDSHVRAICNIESPDLKLPNKCFSMTNLLGIDFEQYQQLVQDLNASGLFDEFTSFHPYWYNKEVAKPLRKMGHLTVLSNDDKKLKEIEELIDELLGSNPPHPLLKAKE